MAGPHGRDAPERRKAGPRAVPHHLRSEGPAPARLRLELRGAVQGVGFRPFAAGLARALSLSGFARNTGFGAEIEIEGPDETLEQFTRALRSELPPPGRITALEQHRVPATGARGFHIVSSAESSATAQVLPDQATCAACLAELSDAGDRRYRYPFVNCTHCGPRYSIIEALPYDRARTTMARFTMCRLCRAEYEDPEDRRFHAQPNACPSCGPRVELRAPGDSSRRDESAIERTLRLLESGAIVAAKGIGGYHLLCDAADPAAVQRLRQRKARAHKPFAVMVPSLAAARALCRLEPLEQAALTSPAAPIVLLRRRDDADDAIAPAVCPGSPDLGLMLPYAPLHHLLLAGFGRPLVATSANLAEEPLCADDDEAEQRLGGIADAFLRHDRAIARCCDDSVVRVMAGQLVVLRSARGLAPAGLTDLELPSPLLAVGAHLKATVAIGGPDGVVLSPHVGDLDSPEGRRHHHRLARDLRALRPSSPSAIVADRHPDYGSRSLAEALAREHGAPLVEVQHHEAHLFACLADNAAGPPCLGVIWDGMGLGADGTLWGGEFLELRSETSPVTRVGHLHPFGLVGGDAAARDTRRAALGLLYELVGDQALEQLPFTGPERASLRRALARGRHVAKTTSAGRLFDGVAALLGLCAYNGFEGQAAQQLEFCARGGGEDAPPYPFELDSTARPLVVDWRPAIRALLDAHRAGEPAPVSAARLHATLVEAIVGVATRVGQRQVVLSGGCFQNPTLLARVVARLREVGLSPLWHRQIPPNDGGLAVGQLVAAARRRAP